MVYTGLSAAIAEYIDERHRLKKEPIEKNAAKVLADEPDTARHVIVVAEYQAELRALDNQFAYTHWLTDAAKRAKQISLVTHAPKFTHGDAKGSGVLDLGASSVARGYLSTLALTQPDTDAIGNAAALDVAKLLQLSVEGRSLADSIAQDDTSPFAPFTADPALLTEWLTGFKLALIDKELSSHTLAKQIFFPIAEHEYHLLSPLFSSSLAHAIHGRIGQSRFSERAKEIREARKAGKYSVEPQVNYPGTASQSYGGSKPQNISILNSMRGGKMLLLSCAPPKWHSHLKPPAGSDILSGREFNRRTWQQINELKAYLLSIAGRDSTLAIRQRRGRYILALVDTLLNYGAEIQSLTEQAGWSTRAGCRLNAAQRLWLDPHHPDETVQQMRSRDRWSGEIAEQFANWLKRRLKDEKMTFALAEGRNWQKVFRQRLWAFDLGQRGEA